MLRKLAAAAVAAIVAWPASAQDTYNIGLTGALTGPPASTYAPAIEAMRVYLERVNAAGGINGRKVNLILQDDSAEPGKATANAKKLLTQDNVVLLINTSLSSTYAPVVAEAKRAGVALLFAASVCPKEVHPPADPLQFCTTAFASGYDSRAALAFVKETAKAPVKIGFSAMAIPLSRGEMDFAEKQAPALGMTVVGKEVIPPPTPDYTPFATNALFQDGLPIHKEIAAAAKKAGVQYPAQQMAEGWIAGMVIEAALKAAGAPSREKLAAAMSSLKVDTKGLRGGPIEWTKGNHFRTRQYYRFYRWDPAKGAIVRVKDWVAFDVK